MLASFSSVFCCSCSASHKRLQQKTLFNNQRISQYLLCNQLQGNKRFISTSPTPCLATCKILGENYTKRNLLEVVSFDPVSKMPCSLLVLRRLSSSVKKKQVFASAARCSVEQAVAEQKKQGYNKLTKAYKTKKGSVFSLTSLQLHRLWLAKHKQGLDKTSKPLYDIKEQRLESAKQKFSKNKPHFFFEKIDIDIFYKTLQSKCSAVKAISSCLYMGPCPSMFSPYSVWSPSMYNFLQGHRENHAVLAFEKTTQKFLESLHLCALIRRKGGSIYVIFDHDGLPFANDTYIEASSCRSKGGFLDPSSVLPSLQSKASKNSKQNNPSAIPYGSVKNLSSGSKTFPGYETPYGWSSEKWVGGTFSNFQQVSKSVSLYGTLSRQFFRFLQQNKNVSSRYTAMQTRFRGNVLSRTEISCQNLKSFLHTSKVKTPVDLCFKDTPDVIIVENANKNRNVIQEAHALNIPVISFADSDVAEQILSKISIGIGLNIYKRSFFYSLLYYIYKIPVSK